ncbi:unnamed protein product [Mesocestoides corti]|uniref:Uncharacterized protein n=1 Tax=Mesocestoides corti TaxID=53468 RepID=A0A0R3U3B8_MESCO|nr:unnamed protein product [Mesocestoides corti]
MPFVFFIGRSQEENQQLRKMVAELQLAIKETRSAAKQIPRIEPEESLQPDTTSEWEGGRDDVYRLPSHASSDKLSEYESAQALQLSHLRKRLKDLKAREAYQRVRADDLNISVEAYKMALEEQFKESQKFISQFTKRLEEVFQSPEKPTTEAVVGVRSDLTQWIEQALKSAFVENTDCLRSARVNFKMGTSKPDMPAEAFERHYTQYPVNGRSLARRTSFRIQSLSKALEVLHGAASPKASRVSPLETLLLMVNEILEKLTKARMEDFIHSERRNLLRNSRTQPKPTMVTTIV